jgi:hypothetical protein
MLGGAVVKYNCFGVIIIEIRSGLRVWLASVAPVQIVVAQAAIEGGG